MGLAVIADLNLNSLRENTYPGRGIVVGEDEIGKNVVQIYWIMGRSENSRNRVFGHTNGRLFTEAADASKVKDPSLIIYNAMQELRPSFVVSNGHQTKDALKLCDDGKPLSFLRRMYSYEPDPPNNTPRITGVCTVGVDGKPSAELSIIRKSLWSDACEHHLFRYEELGTGFGYCITTYEGNGNPLPSFKGEPYLLPIRGNHEAITHTFWESLNRENRVSLAVKMIDIASRESKILIVNQYPKISPV